MKDLRFLLKNFEHRCKKMNFFLGVVFLLSQVLWGQKLQIYFENSFPGAHRFELKTLRDYQKQQFVMIILDAANPLSPNEMGEFFHLGLNRLPFTCPKVFLGNFFDFVFRVRILIDWQIKKLPVVWQTSISKNTTSR